MQISFLFIPPLAAVLLEALLLISGKVTLYSLIKNALAGVTALLVLNVFSAVDVNTITGAYAVALGIPGTALTMLALKLFI